MLLLYFIYFLFFMDLQWQSHSPANLEHRKTQNVLNIRKKGNVMSI